MQADRRAAYLRALSVDTYSLRSADEEVAELADSTSPARESQSPADTDWSLLPAAVESCRACELGGSRTRSVFGVGSSEARWMIIGEAPGAEEDRQGEPFVGRAGKLLDEMLRAIGLDRESVFIANVLKCRPPNNRDPAAAEIASCRHFLEQQIRHIQPEIILIVGRIAAQALLDTKAPLGRLRGQMHTIEPDKVPAVVTYHPAYLLRSPAQKSRAWQDLKFARSALRESA